MANYSSKKRVRELQKDAFRDRVNNLYHKLLHKIEGKGRPILYGLAAAFVIAAIIFFFINRNLKRDREAGHALGAAIETADAQVTTSPPPGSATLTFKSEQERAQAAVEEFQRVANKYGSPYREQALYLAASNRLTVDRGKGVSELEALAKGNNGDVSILANFALAQAHESDGQYDQAATIYKDLIDKKLDLLPSDSLKLRLANTYEKQNKKTDAARLLFEIVDTFRKQQAQQIAKDPNSFDRPSTTIQEAEKKLQNLDPTLYSQLTPAPQPPRSPHQFNGGR
ncbi:MAG: tetratricopeptide repeat protein [Pyrinomonadaceae bacterium]